MSLTARRAAIDRWIIALTPLAHTITACVAQLGLGAPDMLIGPSFMGGQLFRVGGDRIRKGAVWWIEGKNHGFHVDFLRRGLTIEAWSSTRRVQTALQHADTGSLTRDLNLCLSLSGLTATACTSTEEPR